MKCYDLQLLQALKPDDKDRRCKFYMQMQADVEDRSATRLVSSYKATFHLGGKVNCGDVRVWYCESSCRQAASKGITETERLLRHFPNNGLRPVFLHGQHGHRHFLPGYVEKCLSLS
jgi:hypothetical protein